MKTVEKPVTSARDKNGNLIEGAKRQKVATVTYNQYDSVDEARSALGDEVVLDYTNAQVATNAKNKARAEAVGGVSDASLKNDALARLVSTPEGLAALQACAGDGARMAAVLSSAIQALKKERGIASNPAPVEDDEPAETTAAA